MPIIPPAVPPAEVLPRDRILKKYSEYIYEHGRGIRDATSLQGERYEIAVAVHLYRQGRLVHGNQIGRWTPTKPGAPAAVRQDVTLGGNTEYDFFLRGTAGWNNLPQTNLTILGEAKSYTGVGVYIRQAITFCMHDASLGGICFVTPENPYTFFLTMMLEVHSVLAKPGNSVGIAGGDSWKNSPRGQRIVTYFAQEYSHLDQHNRIATYQNIKASQVTNQVAHTFNPHTNRQEPTHYQRNGNKRLTANFLNQELFDHAGIVAFCLQVPKVNHDQLKDLVGNI